MAKKNLLTKRIFSIILALAVALSMMPMTVWGGETAPVAEVTINGTATQYTNIDEAFKAADVDGQTAKVTLLQDTEIPKKEDQVGIELKNTSNITFDLKGHKLKQQAIERSGAFFNQSAVFYVVGGACLTIDDTATDGRIIQPSGGFAVTAMSDGKAPGKIIVNGGIIENTSSQDYRTEGVGSKPNCAIFVNCGSVEINGGTLIGKRGAYVQNGTLTVTGTDDNVPIFNGSETGLYFKSGTVTLSGGKYTSTDENGCGIETADVQATSLLANGYRYTDATGKAITSSADDNKKMPKDTYVKKIPEGEAAYIDAAGEWQTQIGCIDVTESTTELSGNWYVVRQDVSVASLKTTSETNLILCDGANLNLTGRLDASAAKLNIYLQTNGTGQITATAGINKTANIIRNIAHLKMVNDTGKNLANEENITGSVTISKCDHPEQTYTSKDEEKHTAVCSFCQITIEGNHNFGSWTFLDESKHRHVCEACKYSIEKEHITEKITPNVDGLTHSGKCKDCKHTINSAGHNYQEATGACTCGAKLTATYNNTDYATLQSAINAVGNSGGTVQAKAEVVGEHIKIEEGQSLTLDLNGKTLVSSANREVASGTLVINGGSLTLKNGTVAGASEASAKPAVILNGGALILGEDVTITGGQSANDNTGYPAISTTGGTLKINNIVRLNGGILITGSTKLEGSLPEGMVITKNNGTTGYNGYSVSVEGSTKYKNVRELLAAGYAFAYCDENGNLTDWSENAVTEPVVTNGYQLLRSAKVVPHTKHTFKYGNGEYECDCGEKHEQHHMDAYGRCTECDYACDHKNVTETEDNFICSNCKAKMAVKVTHSDKDTYYAKTFDADNSENTLQTLLNNDTITPNGSTVTLLADDLQAFAFVDGDKNITLNLNGKNLIELVNGGFYVDTGSTLTVTGEGSSTRTGDPSKGEYSYVFNVRGGTLKFDGNFGGKDSDKLNAIRVGSKDGKAGTLTSAVDFKDYLKIGTLQIDDSSANVTFVQGTFDRIIVGAGIPASTSVTLGGLLKENCGNAFQKADGTFVPYNTKISADKPVENVKITGCYHDSATDRTCNYCGKENLVAMVIDGGSSIWDYSANDSSDEAAKTAVSDALESFNDSDGDKRTLKPFIDFAFENMSLNAITSRGTSKLTETQRIIDLNGHTITGGTMTANDLVTLTITDSSKDKNGSFANVTVNAGASLIVDGVPVGTITANDKTAKVTLKGGSKFSSYALPEGMTLADCLDTGCYVYDSGDKDKNKIKTDESSGTATEKYVVVKVQSSGGGGGGATIPTSEVTTDKTDKTDEKATSSPTEVKNETKTDASGKKVTTAKVTVSKANQKEILKQAKDNKSGEIVINVSEKEVADNAKLEISLDKDFIDSIVKDTDAKLTIKTPEGDKTFTQAELKKLAEAAEGDTVTIDSSVFEEPTEPSEPSGAVTPAQKKIAKGVENTTMKVKATRTKSGKIILKWTKSKGYKVEYFEIYRSTKKNSGYGKKPFFRTKDGEKTTYVNTKNIKKGKTYYYKIRGVRVINGKKYYTEYSNKTWRTMK